MSLSLPIEMSIKDQIKAIEILIHEEEKEMASPAWHKDIIEFRRNRIKSENAKFLSIEDLKNKN